MCRQFSSPEEVTRANLEIQTYTFWVVLAVMLMLYTMLQTFVYIFWCVSTYACVDKCSNAL